MNIINGLIAVVAIFALLIPDSLSVIDPNWHTMHLSYFDPRQDCQFSNNLSLDETLENNDTAVCDLNLFIDVVCTPFPYQYVFHSPLLFYIYYQKSVTH